MLDKSLPYFNIIMKRKSGSPILEAKLPDGLKFVFYKEGDEHRWAEIETSVGEFSNKNEALDYFQREYINIQMR